MLNYGDHLRDETMGGIALVEISVPVALSKSIDA